ncbi:hypothetical protein RIF29_09954 [Crotalaria pallida]|uniref:Uncharacterized protein n=1 Tax=Crotalaria pallida TaxID=3830 RepID=A0AAN9FSB0_CROPI
MAAPLLSADARRRHCEVGDPFGATSNWPTDANALCRRHVGEEGDATARSSCCIKPYGYAYISLADA